MTQFIHIIYIWCLSIGWLLGTARVQNLHDVTPTLLRKPEDGVGKKYQSVTLCWHRLMSRQWWGQTEMLQRTWWFPKSSSDSVRTSVRTSVRRTRCWIRGGWWRACPASCWTSPWVWPAGACAPPHRSARPSEQSPAWVWLSSVGSSQPVLNTKKHRQHQQQSHATFCTTKGICFTSVSHAASFFLHLLLHFLQLLTDLKHNGNLVGRPTLCWCQTNRNELQLQQTSSEERKNIPRSWADNPSRSCSGNLAFHLKRWGSSRLKSVFSCGFKRSFQHMWKPRNSIHPRKLMGCGI